MSIDINQPFSRIETISFNEERELPLRFGVTFLYVLKGAVGVTMNGSSFYLREDDVMMALPKDAVSILASGSNIVVYYLMRSDFFALGSSVYDGSYICNSALDKERDYETIRSLLAGLAVSARDRSVISGLEHRQMADSLLVYLNRYHFVTGSGEDEEGRYSSRIRSILRYLEEHHARSVGHRRQGRPGYDMPFFSKDFIDPKVGVHGPLFDLGIYHLAQMLYVLGMPELESVYGVQTCDYWTHPAIDKLTNRIAPVEDLAVAIARFKGGLSMDIYEDWAIHMDEIGPSFIAGSNGALKFLDVDQTGGPMAVPASGQIVGGGELQKPRLVYFGIDSHDQLFETKIDCAINDITGQQELLIHPEMAMYNDNQLQWYSYLRGELTDETRIDSPYIAMQTAFLSEGVVMSSELGRSVTADEIRANAKSIALREQETPFGTIKYDFDDYTA